MTRCWLALYSARRFCPRRPDATERLTAQDALKKLPGEAKRQAAHVARVDGSLRQLRERLSRNPVLSSRSSREMLQNCIIPRLLMSPEDALFCARFIHRMHDLDTPGFPTCLVINEVRISMPSQQPNRSIHILYNNGALMCASDWKPTAILAIYSLLGCCNKHER